MAGRRWRVVAVVSVAAALLAARAPDGVARTVPSRSQDACDLLTDAEAEQLLGVPTFGASEDTDRSSGTYCQWVSRDTPGGDADASGEGPDAEPYFISVVEDHGRAAVQDFESGRRRHKKVDGIGDDAYDSLGLVVRSGDRVLMTFASGNQQHPLSHSDATRIERRAARFALDHLGPATDPGSLKEERYCGRTHLCAAGRYHACARLKASEVEYLLRAKLDEIDGTSITTGSDKRGMCEYTLQVPPPNPHDDSERFNVTLYVEPDAEAAHTQYQDDLTLQHRLHVSPQSVPSLGEQAFYDSAHNGIVVLRGNVYFEITLEARLPGGEADTSPALGRALVRLAELVAERI